MTRSEILAYQEAFCSIARCFIRKCKINLSYSKTNGDNVFTTNTLRKYSVRKTLSLTLYLISQVNYTRTLSRIFCYSCADTCCTRMAMIMFHPTGKVRGGGRIPRCSDGCMEKGETGSRSVHAHKHTHKQI